MLHITNGRSVSIAESGIAGEVIYWNDILHEGPVPAGLSLEELSTVRAEFIAQALNEPEEIVQLDFKERDGALEDFSDHEEVVLWFEHDLYDQLQLIQLLHYFASQDLGSTRLSLLQSSEYLGPMLPHQLAAMFPERKPVHPNQLVLGQLAWTLFRSPDPIGLAQLMTKDTSSLPYLNAAILRHLEQFPSIRNGLAKTDQQIIDAAAEKQLTAGEAFLNHNQEEPVFMGDSVYFLHLRRLAECPIPLIRVEPSSKPVDSVVFITEAGRKVQTGESDQIEINGIDRWLGGIHLTSPHQIWRWDGSQIKRT